MGNVLDYLAWRGDLGFENSPFNEVDNLILAELAYTQMEDIVPTLDQGETITLRELCEGYEKHQYRVEGNANDAYPLLRAAARKPRFSDLRTGAYINRIDVKKAIQFAAVSFYLDDGTTYVAFRGTDNTLVGWREDFTISYLSETPGQYEAVHYLERIAARTEGPLRVGGHSKGGNLAVYAAAFCSKSVSDRILSVYSNDGPGFNRSVEEAPEYQNALEKVHLIIPESSMIGILLSNKKEKTVIKSSASGMQQHDPYTWQIEGPHFVIAESQSQASLFLDETLRRWMKGLNAEQLETFVRAIFDSMDAAGVQTLTELNANRWNSYNAILKAALEMDPGLKKEILNIAQKLAAAGREVLLEDAGLSIKETIAQLFDAIGGNEDKSSDR